jgi:hypothetical protein
MFGASETILRGVPARQGTDKEHIRITSTVRDLFSNQPPKQKILRTQKKSPEDCTLFYFILTLLHGKAFSVSAGLQCHHRKQLLSLSQPDTGTDNCTLFYRQVFWLSRPLPAFPSENEQWPLDGKGAYSVNTESGLQRRDRS